MSAQEQNNTDRNIPYNNVQLWFTRDTDPDKAVALAWAMLQDMAATSDNIIAQNRIEDTETALGKYLDMAAFRAAFEKANKEYKMGHKKGHNSSNNSNNNGSNGNNKQKNDPIDLAAQRRQRRQRRGTAAEGTQEETTGMKTSPQPETEDIHATDLGNAQRLVNRHGANLRYVHAWKSWFVWTGKHWERDDAGEITRLAVETVKDMGMSAFAGETINKALARWAMLSESEARLKAMVALAQSDRRVVARTKDFDNQPWMLNCRNVTVDLKTGECMEHDKCDMLTTMLDLDFDPQAQCPTFLGFLDKIMAGNKNLIAFLQRAIGYSLTADISEECMFVAWGGGSNGKSTLMNVIRALLGTLSRTMSPDTLAASNKRSGSGPSSDIARLKGSRFISAIETDEGQRLNESLVKQLTSLEPIVARFLNQEDFEFAPTWKLWLATNHMPTIRGTDKGIWRRIRLIPFNVTIDDSEKDETLPARLTQELPGILNWAIKGCLAWQRDGLGVPEEVKQATAGYRAEMDILGAFISERCVVFSTARASYKDLYDDYKAWCEENREYALKAREFAKRLEERGFIKARSGSTGTNKWKGVGLKTDYPDHVTCTEETLGDASGDHDSPCEETQENSGFSPSDGTEETSLLKHAEAFLGVGERDKNLRKDTCKNASVCFSASVSSVDTSGTRLANDGHLSFEQYDPNLTDNLHDMPLCSKGHVHTWTFRADGVDGWVCWKCYPEEAVTHEAA